MWLVSSDSKFYARWCLMGHTPMKQAQAYSLGGATPVLRSPRRSATGTPQQGLMSPVKIAPPDFTPPQSPQREAAAAAVREAAGAAGAAGPSVATGPPPLPEGWSEYHTEPEGQIYFVHDATGEASWVRPLPRPELPTPVLAFAAAAAARDAAAAARGDAAHEPEMNDSPEKQWHWDAGSGAFYYTDASGDLQWAC